MYSLEQFIIHQHDAKQAGLHFDLRISIPNRDLLASFALPKMRIPQSPGDKVLAVRTNDHGRYWINVDKMDIPDGEYGAGKITTFDKGRIEIEGWSKDHITFQIRSSVKDSFNGRYALIKFKGGKTHDRDNLWVLVKTKKQ